MPKRLCFAEKALQRFGRKALAPVRTAEPITDLELILAALVRADDADGFAGGDGTVPRVSATPVDLEDAKR